MEHGYDSINSQLHKVNRIILEDLNKMRKELAVVDICASVNSWIQRIASVEVKVAATQILRGGRSDTLCNYFRVPI